MVPSDIATAQVPTVVPGVPNVTRTAGEILSGLNEPNQGRTAIIAYHNGVLYTVPELPSSQPGSDFQVRSWDLSDPTAPVVTGTFGVSPMPINAHGYLKTGDYLSVGANWPPEAPWSFRYDTPGANTRTENPELLCAGVRGCLFQPFFVSPTLWSYGDIVNEPATLQRDWVEMGSFEHLDETGVIGHPFLLGDLIIFASDQSRTGVATWDVSDPANPVLLDVLTNGGPGGYWPELWGGNGKLYVVFPYNSNGNGIRVVDATDPSDLQFVADQPLGGDDAMYVQFQDEYAFVGSHKVDMRTFQSVLDLDGANTVRPNDNGVGIDTSQFALPIGNLLVTGGIGANQGMAIWAHQSAPDTRGPSVGFHIPQAGRTNYPLDLPLSFLIHETLETPTIVNGKSFIVRPMGGSPIAGSLTFAFDDILTFAPDAPLLPNTTYEVVFPAGLIRDAAGNGIEGYSFSFSTGSNVGGNAPPDITSLTASIYPVPPGDPVTMTASATDDSDTPELRFDFGDGSPKTAWSTTTSAQHSYTEAGHYQVTVQARDGDGSLAARSTTVTVLVPPIGPFPTHSSPIACDVAARTIWSVNPDNDTVTRLDADDLTADLEVSVCDDPRAIARTAQNQAWVSCRDDDRIYVLDAAGGFVDSIDLGYGSGPAGLAVSPAGTTAFVALQHRGQLVRFDTATRNETGRLDLGPRPRAVAVSGNGSDVYVTRLLSPRHHAEVWEVDATTMTLQRTLEIRKFGGHENRDGTAAGRGTLNYLTGITLSLDGQSAWVVGNKPNTERGLLFFHDLDQDNTVRNVAVQIDLASGDVINALDIDNSDSASALAFSPFGDYLFVTLQGNNEIVIFDALALDSSTGLGSLVTRVEVGDAPQGLCVDPDTNRILVKDFLGRTVTALDATNFFAQGTKNLPASAVATVSSEALAPSVLTGKRIFYNATDPRMSAEGYVSCASCHLDGGHDGRSWDFTGRGEGLRNTTSLRGRGGMDHGNVHWSANFDEIQDFEHDIRGPFGGSGFMEDADFAATDTPLGPPKAGLSADLDALAAYVASLGQATVPRSPFRQADGSTTAEANLGRQLFVSQGCGTCHSGSAFADSTLGTETLHDVGTLGTVSGQRLGGPLGGIDTPTLLGLWNTEPYFHDGSAQTLEDVFRIAGGTLYPAEEATPSNGGRIIDTYVELNNDDVVRGRAYGEVQSSGAALTFDVDGGSGGPAQIAIRYSRGYNTLTELWVNGVLQDTFVPPATGNDPLWRHTNWAPLRFDINLQPGPANTIALVAAQQSNLSVDDLIVATADDLAAAEPHRRVLALSQNDQDALLAYLRQLDDSESGNPFEANIFGDGFESGNTSAWSATVD